MATVKLVPEDDRHPMVRRVFEDIKATKKIDMVPNIWRALAAHPEHLEPCWTKADELLGIHNVVGARGLRKTTFRLWK
jgi:hypothetical protein